MKKKMYTILIIVTITITLYFLLIPNNTNVNSKAIIDIPKASGTIKRLPWAENNDFLKAQKENDTDVLMAAYCTVFKKPSENEKFNVQLAANSIAGVIIKPNCIFSLNNTIGPYDEEKGYKAGRSYIGSEIKTTVGGGVCKVATTLYNVSILGNLEIIERYNHFMPVSYVPHGQDATVAYGSKDLKIKNNYEYPVLIWAQGIENRLYISIYGKETPPNIEWNHKILNKIQAPKIYKKNPNIPEGKEKTIIKGMDGISVESWISISDLDGKIENKYMGISQYWPMPYVIERNK